MSEDVDQLSSEIGFKDEEDIPLDEGIGAEEDEDKYTVDELHSYEENRDYAITNLKNASTTVKKSIKVAHDLGNDANNTAALGKVAELGKVYMDMQKAIVQISRDDLDMKEKKDRERAERADRDDEEYGNQNQSQPGTLQSLLDEVDELEKNKDTKEEDEA